MYKLPERGGGGGGRGNSGNARKKTFFFLGGVPLVARFNSNHNNKNNNNHNNLYTGTSLVARFDMRAVPYSTILGVSPSSALTATCNETK